MYNATCYFLCYLLKYPNVVFDRSYLRGFISPIYFLPFQSNPIYYPDIFCYVFLQYLIQGFKCGADCTFCTKMHYLRITAQKRCFFFKLHRTSAKAFDYKRPTINVKIGREKFLQDVFSSSLCFQ